jgi:hypothetical protein
MELKQKAAQERVSPAPPFVRASNCFTGGSASRETYTLLAMRNVPEARYI